MGPHQNFAAMRLLLLPNRKGTLLTLGFAIVAFCTVAFTVSSNNNLITIDLLSFEAHMNGHKVDIQWVTGYERNSDYYVIERSLNGRDFEEVMRTEGAGKSNMIIKYFDVDIAPIEGLSYYRLKQITTNGQHAYSGLVPVDYNASGEPGMGVFSNSVSDDAAAVHLESLVDQEVLVVLRGEKGDEAYGMVKLTSIGSTVTAVDPSGQLAKGVYLITASDENVLYSRKLTIE